jgi:type 1 fimbria pilin
MKLELFLLGWLALATGPSLAAPSNGTADPTATKAPFDSLVSANSSGPKWWTTLGQDSLPYDSLQKITINLGVVPGSDANGAQPRKVANAFSLSLVSAEAGAIRGVQGSGAMNDVEGAVRGVQVAGGLNLVGGDMSGLQASGVNLVHGNVTGFQYGSLFNRVGGDVEGMQLAVIGNITESEVRGLQSSSIVNRARSIEGVQHGFVNLSDRVRGLQFGIINVADDVAGFQWGMVNIADTMVGPQLGLINIRPDARYFVEGWFDEVGMRHLGLNYGSPGWYNLLQVATNSKRRVEVGFAFGGRMPSRRLILSLDLGASLVVNSNKMDHGSDEDRNDMTAEWDAINGLFQARTTVGWHVWNRLAVFAGGSWNALVVPEDGRGTHQLRPYGGYHWDATDHLRMWPGLFAGIRI